MRMILYPVKIFRSVSQKLISAGLFLIACIVITLPSSVASAQANANNFQRSIVDFRSRLNPKFKKVKRKETKYIIVHTSELGLNATLRVERTKGTSPPIRSIDIVFSSYDAPVPTLGG